MPGTQGCCQALCSRGSPGGVPLAEAGGARSTPSGLALGMSLLRENGELLQNTAKRTDRGSTSRGKRKPGNHAEGGSEWQAKERGMSLRGKESRDRVPVRDVCSGVWQGRTSGIRSSWSARVSRPGTYDWGPVA